MRMIVLLTVAIIALVAWGLVTFGSALAPDAVPARSPARSLADSRVFMLLPDGTVEITNTGARRLYRWDGEQWRQVEPKRVVTPAAEMQ